jgi:chromate transport protein ChrA
MNQDVKELIETCVVLILVIIFAICAMLCVKWGVPYQTLVVFAGFIGTLLGILGMKMRATGGSNGSPKADIAPPSTPTT